MIENIEIKKKLVDSWFDFLQLEIIKVFQYLENNHYSNSKKLKP